MPQIFITAGRWIVQALPYLGFTSLYNSVTGSGSSSSNSSSSSSPSTISTVMPYILLFGIAFLLLKRK